MVFRLFIGRFWKSLNRFSCQGTMIVLRWMCKLVQRLTKVYLVRLVFCRILCDKICLKSFIYWVILLDEWNIYYISCLIDPLSIFFKNYFNKNASKPIHLKICLKLFVWFKEKNIFFNNSALIHSFQCNLQNFLFCFPLLLSSLFSNFPSKIFMT